MRGQQIQGSQHYCTKEVKSAPFWVGDAEHDSAELKGKSSDTEQHEHEKAAGLHSSATQPRSWYLILSCSAIASAAGTTIPGVLLPEELSVPDPSLRKP